MQPITPFLWFEKNAEDAVAWYTSIFEDAKTGTVTHYNAASAKVSGQPEGSVMTVEFILCGQQFTAINGGPYFHFTPALSFFVHCETEEQSDALWAALSKEGGKVLFEYQMQPWSTKYGWLNDKYGVSWQINFDKRKQSIAPAMLFVGDRYGKAEEAIHFYTSLFPNSAVNMMAKNGPENPTEKEGTIQYANFSLNGQEFNAMEGNKGHEFTFTPAVSFVISCDTQEDIDRYWNALSAVKEAEQCGWLQDKYGISWQVVPSGMQAMMSDPEKASRVMDAMLPMKKIDIATLQQAYEG